MFAIRLGHKGVDIFFCCFPLRSLCLAHPLFHALHSASLINIIEFDLSIFLEFLCNMCFSFVRKNICYLYCFHSTRHHGKCMKKKFVCSI